RAELAPSTIKAAVLTVGQVFKAAARDGILPSSPTPPTRELVGVIRDREEQCFLTAEQVNALADSIDERFRVAVYVAAYGGLRAGELWALKRHRVNVLGATIDVVESL